MNSVTQELNDMVQVQSSEVQRVIRVCTGEKETRVYRDKHLLDVFTCFAWFQPLNNPVR